MRQAETDRSFLNGFLEARLSSTPTDVAVIADRSPLNIESIISHAQLIGGLSLRGIVVPGSELDGDVRRLVSDESLMRAAYDESPEIMQPMIGLDAEGEPQDRGDFVLQYFHPVTDETTEFFRLAHEPYDAAKLRMSDGEGDAYRAAFGQRIINQLRHMDPSVIFLDNFKVILPTNVVQAFPNQIINVHPSMLPLIKGWRPEKRAYEGENPQAYGYTMHIVSEDLDGGPTLLQQRVPIMPVDEKLRAELGDDVYQTFREEQARIRIMVAQSSLVPWVLHLFNSDLDRKIVEGPAAFKAEGRPHFTRTTAYREAADTEGKPYQRVLFENPLANKWRSDQAKYLTLEQLLEVPDVASVSANVSGIHHYEFEVPVLTDDPRQATFTHVEHLVAGLRAAGMQVTMQTGQILEHRAEVRLITVGNSILPVLHNMGIAARGEQQRVNVRTPRRPVAARHISYSS